jgi:hypothetical protein
MNGSGKGKLRQLNFMGINNTTAGVISDSDRLRRLVFYIVRLVATEQPAKSPAYFFLAVLYRLAFAAWAFLMFAMRALV